MPLPKYAYPAFNVTLKDFQYRARQNSLRFAEHVRDRQLTGITKIIPRVRGNRICLIPAPRISALFTVSRSFCQIVQLPAIEYQFIDRKRSYVHRRISREPRHVSRNELRAPKDASKSCATDFPRSSSVFTKSREATVSSISFNYAAVSARA